MARQHDRVPPWVTTPLRYFIDYVRQLDRYVKLSTTAISSFSNSDRLVDAVRRIEALEAERSGTTPDPGNEDERRPLLDAIALAKSEVERGFPLLYAHSTVALWSALEVLAEDVLVAWLENDPTTRRIDRIARLRVPLAATEFGDPDSRFRLLADLIVQDQAAEQRVGLGALDACLRPIGLGVSLSAEMRRDLLELQQTRHCIVHRAGRADSALVRQCPWLNVKPGDSIIVTHEALQRYSTAALEFASDVLNRATARFDSPQPAA